MHSGPLLAVLCLLPLAPLHAQLTAAPTLTAPPSVQYPPIAKAAHVQGQVVVDFSIDTEGRTVSVQTISGPPMLRGVVEGAIKQWRFRTPLPVTAETNFEATYKFTLNTAEETLDDDLDGPPFVPCCGDNILLPFSANQVTGEVRSLGGSQKIDVSPAAVVSSRPICPGDKGLLPPTETAISDFVELYRTGCHGVCLDYRVRVYRDGRIEWHGRENVVAFGEGASLLNPQSADALLTLFLNPAFWSECSFELPSPEQDPNAEDFARADFLTASIHGHSKTTTTGMYATPYEEMGEKLAWAIDRAADTHRWRHGESATESYANMLMDLQLPKPGITALMRATDAFSPATAQPTFEPLKRLLARGVDLNAADESGWTALMYAAGLGRFDHRAADLLLAAHAEVNLSSRHGDTALLIAASQGDLNPKLLAAGADLNTRNADGVTPLMLLAQYGDPETLASAIASGALANPQDNAGHTALDYLNAAACHKPLIPLGQPSGYDASGVVYPADKTAVPCPATDRRSLQSAAILKSAMNLPHPTDKPPQ